MEIVTELVLEIVTMTMIATIYYRLTLCQVLYMSYLIPHNSELDTISLSLHMILGNLPLYAQQVNYISGQGLQLPDMC